MKVLVTSHGKTKQENKKFIELGTTYTVKSFDICIGFDSNFHLKRAVCTFILYHYSLGTIKLNDANISMIVAENEKEIECYKNICRYIGKHIPLSKTF